MQLASVVTPESDMDVFPFMNKLRQEAGEQPPSALLKRFHDALAELFPDTPWADGHFAGEAGRLTVVRRRKVVVPHVLYIAGELGLTVVDNQSGEVHRPPTYQVVLEGPAEGVDLGDAAARLAALMRKPVTEMLALLSGGRRTVVKKGVSRFLAEQYAGALRERAGCRTTLAHESGPAPREKPPAPPIVLAPKDVEPPKHVMPPMSAEAKAEAQAHIQAQAKAEADVEAHLEANGTDADLFDVAEGIRLVCSTIVLSFMLRGIFHLMPLVPAAFCGLVVLLMEVYGVMRLTSGLRFGGSVRRVLILTTLSPILVGLAGPFLHLSMKAVDSAGAVSSLVVMVLGVLGSRRLAKAGYKTGLFGASKADVRYLGAMGDSDRLQSTTLAWGAFILIFGAYMTGGMTKHTADFGGQTKEVTERTSVRDVNELPAGQTPCEFVGTWEMEKDSGKFAYNIADDGTYSAIQVSGTPREGGAIFSGHWTVARESLYWSDESVAPVKVTKNRVVGTEADLFSALEPKEGSVLMFRLKGRGKSARCNY